MEIRTNPGHLAENDATTTTTTTTPKIVDLAAGQTRQGLQDIAFGSIAGIIGKFVEYPFDTVKVRLQSQPQNKPLQYTGPLDCFRQSWQRDGLRGLYRGISAPIVGAAIETSSLFFSYRVAQDILLSTYYAPTVDPSSTTAHGTTTNPTPPLPMRALILCGAASGAVTSLLLTPIELVKCKMQVSASSSSSTTHTTTSPLQLITTIFRTQGLLGFWHGQLGTLIRETGGSAAWFGSFEGMSLLFRKLRREKDEAVSFSEGEMMGADAGGRAGERRRREEQLEQQEKDTPLPLHQQLIAGASAGMAYNFVFYPADTIKSRMQTEEVVRGVGRAGEGGSRAGEGGGVGRGESVTRPSPGATKRQTFYQVGRALWRDQGLKGMYRGCGITVGRAAPSSALIFTVYEYLKGLQL